jgi:hypothetical protein
VVVKEDIYLKIIYFMAEATTPDLTTIKLRTSTLVELRNLKKTLRLKSVKDVITYLTNYFTDEPCERAQTDVQVQLAQLRQDVYGKLDKIHELLAAQEQI